MSISHHADVAQAVARLLDELQDRETICGFGRGEGQRFLALVPAPVRGDAGVTVLTNWQTTLNVR